MQGEFMTPILTRRTAVRASLGAALTMPFIRRAHAETSVVAVARRYGIQALQQDVMEQQKLVEKHAASLGVPGLRATFPRFTGTTLINEGMMSGAIHMGGGSFAGLLALWDKTDGGVKAASALNAGNQRLLTINPAIKAVADITAADRIAMPSIGVGAEAVYLQMAASKAWGRTAWSKLDKQTVLRTHSEAARLLAKKDITCHFSASPYQEAQLATPGVREVTNIFAIAGRDDLTPFGMYGKLSFRNENPQTWLAVMAAFQDATDWINEHPADAAQIYVDNTGEKGTAAEVLAAMNAPGTAYTLQPRGLMQVAEFMASTGAIKRAPNRIEDLVFPELLEADAN